MFSWLAFWKRRRHTPLVVRMYTRVGCHLCETAWTALEVARDRWGFRLEAVDVDSDPNLAKTHGAWVPVITVNDKVRFRGILNPVLLDRLLRQESR